MQNLVQRLIAEERRAGKGAADESRAALRICEKLRHPLSSFAGTAGYRSLLARAVTLAKVEAPLLAGAQVKPDGTFDLSAELEAQLATREAARAGAVLVGQLLDLLITFIGPALTLRFVHDVWPAVETTTVKVRKLL